MAFTGILSALGLVGGFVQDALNRNAEHKKELAKFELSEKYRLQQKQIDNEILQKQIELAKAGVDIETQKTIATQLQTDADIHKSNNQLEESILELRKEEIKSHNLEYIKKPNGEIGLNNFFLGLCNFFICITNCFKAVPLFLIVVLIGFSIFIRLVLEIEPNTIDTSLMGLLEIMVSYFTGRKISNRVTESTEKKK